MKLKQLYVLVAAFSMCLASSAWAAGQDDFIDDADASMQVLAAVGDEGDAMLATDVAADEASAEDDAALLEELTQVCEVSAQESGVAPEAVDQFVKNCIIENSGALVDEQSDNAEGDVEDGETVVGDASAVEGDDGFVDVADVGAAEGDYVMNDAEEYAVAQ